MSEIAECSKCGLKWARSSMTESGDKLFCPRCWKAGAKKFFQALFPPKKEEQS